MITYTNQIQIIHLSDLHFGSKHICSPEDPTASYRGIKSLSVLLQEDLGDQQWNEPPLGNPHTVLKETPVLLIVSGDFTQIGSDEEFQRAERFLNELISKPLLGTKIDKNRIFIVPGNHDINFTGSSVETRFQPYSNFYNNFFDTARTTITPRKAGELTQVHVLEIKKKHFAKRTRNYGEESVLSKSGLESITTVEATKRGTDKYKIIVAEINCSMYVEKNTVDQSRGHVDFESIAKLRRELEQLKERPDFVDFIKVAVIHHHVILLPSFIEPGRGVDAVVNAKALINLLTEFNFHLVLHGHKHIPQAFSYDPESLWNTARTPMPMLVVSGGSCGSNELPSSYASACNTYSVISLKWHPSASRARIKVITRGLELKGNEGLLTPDKWKWKLMNISDKSLMQRDGIPPQGKVDKIKKCADDSSRSEIKMMLRFCHPVAEVMPSLIPEQACEVRLWIAFHKHNNNKSPRLIEVEWSAGRLFNDQICVIDQNPTFCVTFHYWGPVLVHARLTFEDGYECNTSIYARMP